MDWSMAGPLIGGGVSTVGGLLSSIFGGSDAKDMAGKANEIQQDYLRRGTTDWTQWTGRGMNYLSPYTNMTPYVMSQLFGTPAYNEMQGTGQMSTEQQIQMAGYQRYLKAVQDGGYTNSKGQWVEFKPKSAGDFAGQDAAWDKYGQWYAKHAELYRPMLPRGSKFMGGMSERGKNQWASSWTKNPYPVDMYQNPFSETMLQEARNTVSTGGGQNVPKSLEEVMQGKIGTIGPTYKNAPETGKGSLVGVPEAGKGQKMLGNLLSGLQSQQQQGTPAPAPGQPTGGGGILGNMPGSYIPQVTPTPAPGMQPFTPETYMESPGFKYLQDQLIQALERSAIGQGGLYSGQFADTLNKNMLGLVGTEYWRARAAEEATQQQAYEQWKQSQGLGMLGQQQQFEQWKSGQVDPYMQMLGFGQNAAGGSANILSGMGSGIGQMTNQTGANIAQGYLQAAGQPTTGQQIGGALTGLGGMGLGYGMSQLGGNPYANLFANMGRSTGGTTELQSSTNTSLLTPGSSTWNFLYGR